MNKIIGNYRVAYEEYRQILKILKFNSQNRRKARKYWKGKPW